MEKFNEQGKMGFLEETTKEKISEFQLKQKADTIVSAFLISYFDVLGYLII